MNRESGSGFPLVEQIAQEYAVIGCGLIEGVIEGIGCPLEGARVVYDGCWQAYLADGAIYGETPGGLQRWMEDQAEIAQHQYAIERIRALQAIHRDLRQLSRKRANLD